MFDGVPIQLAVVFAAAQGLGVRRGGQREAGVFIGLGQRDADGGNGLLDEFAGALAGQFVAHFDKGVFVFAARCRRGFLVARFVQPALFALRDDFVDGGYAVAGADVARIHFVVVEVFVAQGAVGVADQAVFLNRGGVEFDLDFHVLRHGGEGGGQLVLQDFFGFFFIVDVAVIAVARIGDLFHHVFVVIARAETQRGERDAAFAFFRHHGFQGVGAGNADVEVAVGGQQDAVDAVFNVGFLRLLISHFQCGFARCRTACLQFVDGAQDFVLVVAGSRRQDECFAVRIGNQGNFVLGA